MANRLFLLAHPDDEMLCLPFILDKPIDSIGKDYFLFLSINSLSTVREAEARKAISHLNDCVGESDIIDFQLVLRDGLLWEDLKRHEIFVLVNIVQSLELDSILSFAYEGGHQDHDIANGLARLFQRVLDVDLIEMSGYRKHNYLPTFVIGDPLEKGARVPFSRFKALKLFLELAAIHRSQFRVWCVLSPSILTNLLLRSTFKAISRPDSPRVLGQQFLYQIRGKASREIVEAAVYEITKFRLETKND
jgi:LmbE family N-acetylglucosaminyl deacetylase